MGNSALSEGRLLAPREQFIVLRTLGVERFALLREHPISIVSVRDSLSGVRQDVGLIGSQRYPSSRERIPSKHLAHVTRLVYIDALSFWIDTFNALVQFREALSQTFS